MAWTGVSLWQVGKEPFPSGSGRGEEQSVQRGPVDQRDFFFAGSCFWFYLLLFF